MRKRKSKFGVKQAEKLGWALVHQAEEEVIDLGDGVSKTIPASFVAEKVLAGGGRLTESAESLEKLVERIKLYEQHLEVKGANQAAISAEVEPDDLLNPNEGVTGAEALHSS